MKIIKELGSVLTSLHEHLTNANSSWANRSYEFYLIFGQTDEKKSPWITSNWKSEFEPLLDKLIKQCELSKETELRVTKYKSEKRISKKEKHEFIYHSEVKLGQLKWDNKSHDKWTTPNNIENYFQDFQLWTPKSTICEKRQSPPDIYISISNESDFEKKRETKFGYFIVVAIAESLKSDSKPIIKELSERINSKATIFKKRRWGKPEKAGNWTFNNWIQDTFSNGIYKGNNLHSFNFDELEFEPTWEVIYRQI